MAAAEPVYEELPGWQKPTAGVRHFEELPPEAQSYVRYIQDVLGAPICLVSVGPEREQAISLGRII
jgi:adenylosuccinate synthase